MESIMRNDTTLISISKNNTNILPKSMYASQINSRGCQIMPESG